MWPTRPDKCDRDPVYSLSWSRHCKRQREREQNPTGPCREKALFRSLWLRLKALGVSLCQAVVRSHLVDKESTKVQHAQSERCVRTSKLTCDPLSLNRPPLNRLNVTLL